MTGEFSNLEKTLIGLVLLGGALVMFFPIQYLIVGLLVFAGLTFLLVNPKICFYLVVFTIPFTERIRILPISFSPNDIAILICFISACLNIFFKDKRVNLKTSIDAWMIILTFLYFITGITSVGETGILSSFKFFEAVIAFYLSIYFVRTKQITIAKIIKTIFITALFQAFLGVFQSLTGIGATFRSARGFWGYFGLGSNMVWHGMGTMGHFNMLGNFLITILLFSLPICYYLIKNKKSNHLITKTLFFGIITTYSRGSLLGLTFGYFYFLFLTMKNKVKFYSISVISGLLVLFLKYYLSNTSYVETLSSRDDIWKGVIGGILSNPRYLWLGGGLNSYEEVVYPYLPQNNTMWFAHNFYLLCVQEMGIIGTIIIFSFLIFIMIDTCKKFKTCSKLLSTISLSTSLCVFSIFFISIYDHAYSLTFFKILLFIILGIVYAKDKKIFTTAV